jgi:hypothetical protein
MKYRLSPTALICFSLCLFSGCGKSSNSTTLAVSAINPSQGSFGDTVTITGSGFASSASQNSVTFNGKMATVINASSAQLQVTVPTLCGTGSIKVSVNSNTASGPIFTFDTTYKETLFATGLSYPYCLTMDATGNLYVTNPSIATVSKISPAGVVSMFSSYIVGCTGIVSDANNNIYVVNNNGLTASTIFKLNPSGTVDTFANIAGDILGLTIDDSGNIYAADNAAGEILKISSSGIVTAFATGMAGIIAIAHSSSGNFYSTASTAGPGNNGIVYKIAPDGSVSTISSVFNFEVGTGIVVDNNENIYITLGGGTISKISVSGTISTIAADLFIPSGLLIDGNGNFYVLEEGGSGSTVGKVFKLTAQ